MRRRHLSRLRAHTDAEFYLPIDGRAQVLIDIVASVSVRWSYQFRHRVFHVGFEASCATSDEMAYRRSGRSGASLFVRELIKLLD